MSATAATTPGQGVALPTSGELLALVHRALVYVNPNLNAIIERLEPTAPLHEIGLESVAMMEMASYLEDELHITLDDRELADVVNIDELAGLLRKQWLRESERPAAPPPPETLHDLLLNLRGNGRVGATFLGADGDERIWTFDDLLREAFARAAALEALGLSPGDRVALLMEDPADFVPTFHGAILQGLVPVPMALPTSTRGLADYLQRTTKILQVAGCRSLIASPQVLAFMQGESTLPGVQLISAATLEGLSDNPSYLPAPATPGDLCFLQFTSGSTADPKGTMVTHGNLVANALAIGRDGLRTDPERDVAVSWLPLYHDMGLIGFVVAPLVGPIPTVYMPTLAFLRRPSRWMQVMSDYRATISFAPNFAYALAARRCSDPGALRLSQVRALGCGAEPINPTVLARFQAAHAAAGLPPEAIVPAYGLAEATLAVSFDSLQRPWRSVRIDRAAYQQAQRVLPVDAGHDDALEFVSCGEVVPGHALRITRDGQAQPEGHAGEIEFRGPSLTPGYLGHAPRGAWLQTGDVGFLLNGQLYVCGRSKDLIVINGRNIHPQDIEWEVEKVDGLRRGSVAAFSVLGDDSERLVIAAETAGRPGPELVGRIRERVRDRFELHLHELVFVPRGALPKTSSGKLQRFRVRARWLDSTLTQPPPNA